ncbi:purine-binding chemotaxis protein CheW [Anaerobacterium chartisolvens]|uniref:Chemotaxis protein CheW n=1 Tax=Anaerobacterium chartisolvens TaxID=1297424 RepID=A0A369B554_9FIRM|nr:chemotaxis protein CheW [Anaerobacterium chartisolvens]RCX16649.1 purine-binding chemotaxis protein CheW [Anaerobacterium chartisolvens]
MSELQIVVFSLNNDLCGADTLQIKQIIKYQEVTKMPQMPEFVDGVVNLRGNVVPIINLNKRFSLGDTEITKKTKVLISEVDGQFIGYIVNDVYELMKLEEEEIEVLPDILRQAGNKYLKSVGKKGEKIISILDLSSILDRNELQTLKS